MNPMQTIQEFAKQKMAEWGLTEKGWTFQWNNSRRSLGRCRFQRYAQTSFIHLPRKPLIKQIIISRFLTNILGEEQQRDTVLHEIAHALDFEQRGKSAHDDTWKWWAVKVGAKPNACCTLDETGNKAVAAVSKYTLRCPNGHDFARHRVFRKDASCPTCNPHKFDERFRLTAIQNY